MSSFKCLCGGTYSYIPDEESDGMPPSFRARQFYCAKCDTKEWLDPLDLGLEEWMDEHEFTG